MVQEIEVLSLLGVVPALAAVSQLLLFFLPSSSVLHLQPGQASTPVPPETAHRLFGQPAPGRSLQTDHLWQKNSHSQWIFI